MRARAFVSQIGQGPMPWLLIVATLGFVMHLNQQQGDSISAICGRISVAYFLEPNFLRSLIWSPWALVENWLIMILFMMPPLLSQQISHLIRSNFPSQRPVAIGLFGITYGLCWVVAGLILVPVGIIASAILGQITDTIFILALSLGWSASPWAQSARNKCHQVRRISVFGFQASKDNLAQGFDTGINCIFACWPWMILPMTVEAGHTVAMLAVGLYLFAERLAPAGPVRWRVPPGMVSLGLVHRFRAS